MTVSITGTLFKALIDDTDATATEAEYMLDQAIDLLNLYGRLDPELSNLTGTAGTKSLSCQSRERGAIYMVARAIYASFFKNAAGTVSAALGPQSSSSSDLMSNPAVQKAVMDAATSLQTSDAEEERDWSRSVI